MTHPLTPPPELVEQWSKEKAFLGTTPFYIYIATRAARWGADQELEACCEWASNARNHGLGWDLATILSGKLRAARRPKPPSLKEQALKAIGVPTKFGEARVIEHREHELVRRALEALPND
jgi:hypothetical protein